jgi:hypothetical protein
VLGASSAVAAVVVRCAAQSGHAQRLRNTARKRDFV